jgi:membrane peptidoglycan carboxypeptidase
VLTQTLTQAKNKDHFAIDSVVDGSFCRTIEGTKICNDPGDRQLSSSRIKLALAMKYSLNTTFDLLALDAGPDEVAKTAHAMGISLTNTDGAKTLVDRNGHTTFGIGIGDYAVTPLDQAAGYATLANGGKVNAPYLVQSATGSDGGIVYRHKGSAKQAIDKKVANDVTLTLKPVANWSGVDLANGRQSAAKTGTEGISATSLNNSDAWMVGYTPQVSAAVWVGTGLSKPIYDANGQPLYGAGLPGKTWKSFMDTYLAGKKHMTLASKQMIAANGSVPKPKPTFTPTPTAPTTSSTPKPTFSITSGFPSTSTPPPSPRTSTPTTTPTPTPTPTNTPTCGRLLLPPCSSSSSSVP